MATTGSIPRKIVRASIAFYRFAGLFDTSLAGSIITTGLRIPAAYHRVGIQAFFRNLGCSDGGGALDSYTFRQIATHVYWISPLLPRRNMGPCLFRSILLFQFLRRYGHLPRIHIGLRKDGDRLQGHAWVTVNGTPLLEQSDPSTRYVENFSYPENRVQENRARLRP